MWKRELTSKPVKTREKRSLNTSLNICACVWVRIGSEGGKGIEIEGERERDEQRMIEKAIVWKWNQEQPCRKGRRWGRQEIKREGKIEKD